MKRLLVCCLIVFSVFILNSCSKQSVTDPGSGNIQSNTSGKLLLKIDKANAPTYVTTVTAYLSRQGCDSLTKSMNIRTDSTADISFCNVLIGTWHLKVDAKSQLGTILYTGESDVSVTEATTTQVNLTLNSTGLGVGNIQINVTWGQQAKWIDYGQNPVFGPSYVSTAKVIYDNGKYQMWYLNTYGSNGDISYAESTDGIHWTSPYGDAVLKPGAPGAWDDYTVGPGAVIKESGVYKMYYNGYRSPYEKWYVGRATSQDGIHWQKDSIPVFTADQTEGDLGVTGIVKVNQTYFLFYSTSSPEWKIKVATSTNGTTWTKYAGNPILVKSELWESPGILFPTVIYDNNQFKMLYMSRSDEALGMATSTDGFHWQKSSLNPVFKLQDISQNWSYKIAYPEWIKVGSQYRLYYSGAVNGQLKIGLATKSGN